MFLWNLRFYLQLLPIERVANKDKKQTLLAGSQDDDVDDEVEEDDDGDSAANKKQAKDAASDEDNLMTNIEDMDAFKLPGKEKRAKEGGCSILPFITFTKEAVFIAVNLLLIS